MKRITIILLFFSVMCSFGFSQSKVTALQIGDRIDFSINGKFFTSYIFPDNEKYPFFYPVNGPSNASVTSIRNANYPHHSSLFFGCDKVNGGNYWQEGIDRGQITSLKVNILETGGDKAVIENECIWHRKDADAPIKDKRLITISSPSKGSYQIDFDITMEMLMDTRIDKTNHSLFSVRMDPDLAVINGGTMINAENLKGEKATFGQPSAWMDFSGERFGKMEGIAVLQHPSNMWYPSPWFTRDYGFISPTPMYWPENGEYTFLKKGESFTLRYRVLVHSGDHIEANIAKEFEKYKSE
ncbi:MAG: PmoA family protein [Dehalococcoidales bacterium]|nr:PmoA family protein [Dehalococcoidales bacterium]